MLEYREIVPTFKCLRWEGDNFIEFDQNFEQVSNFQKELYVAEWRQTEKIWHDHKVAVGQWVVVNQITGRIEVVDDEIFRNRFEIND